MYTPPAERAIDRSWFFDSSEKEATLKPLCQRVEEEFELPTRRLCRYFAGFDDVYLIANPCFGPHLRGFHATVAARNSFPKYLFDCFFHPLETLTMRHTLPSFEEMVAFDSLIYIRSSTCNDSTGLVECYAHELQHFVQYGRTPRLWAVNSVLYQNLKPLEPASVVTDIPTEREANIVSKRVAEKVCGVEKVNKFAEERVRFMDECGQHEERDRWIFFRDIPSSTPFNLLDATLPLVEKYRRVLDFRMDVEKPEWWVGPLDEDETDEAA
jgi:hypothetical protein